MTFSHGALLPDPHGVFNSSLGGKARRAIDLHQGNPLDTVALQELVRQAAARNAAAR